MADRPDTMLDRVASLAAVAGGVLTLAVALLVTASVTMRWLVSAPIDGDFEYVKMATAVAVFTYLPFTQSRRANIMVDTFTARLPARLADRIDALWDIVFALVMGFLAWCLLNGALDAMRSGETTMQRQLVIWPGIALSAALALLAAVIALATAARLARPGAGRVRP